MIQKNEKACVIDLRQKSPEEIFAFLQALLCVRCKLNQGVLGKKTTPKRKKKTKIA